MKKFLKFLTVMLATCLLLGGCTLPGASVSDDDSTRRSSRKDTSISDSVDPDSTDSADKADKKNKGSYSHDDEKSMMSFLAGEWTFVDLLSGNHFATLTFDKDGNVTYNNDFRGYSADGTFTLKNDKYGDPDSLYIDFEMEFNDLDKTPYGDYYTSYTSESFRGDFFVGRTVGQDYLYLRLLGNGTPFFTNFMFNNHYDSGNYTTDVEWFLLRDNKVKENLTPEGAETFDAFVWEYDGQNVYYEKMTAHPYETYAEYTSRHITEAFYTEASTDIKLYSAPLDASAVNISDFDRSLIYEAFPLKMCTLTVDSDGRVTELKRVTDSFYGTYELMELDPEFSVDNFTFKYNNVEYDLTDFIEAPVNAVTDCYRVGDRIVIEGHINPNVCDYLIYNIYSGSFEKEFVGSCLIWQGDDITTALYAYYNEIYDYAGRLQNDLICTITDMEFCGFFGEYNTVYVTGYKENGEEVSGEVEVTPYIDGAMYTWFDYQRSHRTDDWDAFWAHVQPDALAYIIADPPAADAYGMWYEQQIEGMGSTDVINIGALYDFTTVTVYDGSFEPDADGNYKFKYGKKLFEEQLMRGQSVTFKTELYDMFSMDHIIEITANGKATHYQFGKVQGMYDNFDLFLFAE